MIQLQWAKLMWVLYLFFFEYINIPFPWQQHAHTVEVNAKPYLYWDFFFKSQIIRSTGNFLIKFDPKFLVSSYYSAAIFTPLTIRTYQLILKVYSNYKKVVLIFFHTYTRNEWSDKADTNIPTEGSSKRLQLEKRPMRESSDCGQKLWKRTLSTAIPVLFIQYFAKERVASKELRPRREAEKAVR